MLPQNEGNHLHVNQSFSIRNRGLQQLNETNEKNVLIKHKNILYLNPNRMTTNRDKLRYQCDDRNNCDNIKPNVHINPNFRQSSNGSVLNSPLDSTLCASQKVGNSNSDNSRKGPQTHNFLVLKSKKVATELVKTFNNDIAEHLDQKMPLFQKNCAIFMNPKVVQLNKETTMQKSPIKMETQSNNNSNFANKIFLNPKFDKIVQDSSTHFAKTGSVKIPTRITDHQTHDMIKKRKNNRLDSPSTSSSKQPSHLNNKESSSKCHRKCCSSHLFTVNTTKLVCKRNLSQSFESDKSILSRPVFLTKTKLVRTPPSKSFNTKVVGNATDKNLKSKLQEVTTTVKNKLKKQNFSNNLVNLVKVEPPCSAVKKVHSKNGKSLQLIRKLVTSNKCKSDPPVKSLNNYTMKNNHRAQLKKHSLCAVELNKFQYTKVNVKMTNNNLSISNSRNRYVYKKKECIDRQIQVKNKTGANTPLKLRGQSCLKEKNRLINSKYRIIRKQNSRTTNKSESSRKPSTRSNQNSISSSKTKRKWRAPNSTAIANCTRRGLSIVNIGGTFYRCSRTTLTKNKTLPKKVSQKEGKALLLYIGGQKFQLENNGQSLRCLDERPRRKRIDIGGVTFVTSPTGSSLTRTNYHTSRSFILQAKQKSVSQLTKKCRKNNEPCPFFHRLGRCTGKDNGTCVRQHDPKYVAVCKRYIKGECKGPDCLLSHQPSCHNMPVCRHYLAGHCGRDLCLYPHVKVSDNAPICLDFLKGYCTLGDQCTKRHHLICPRFEKGLCSRGKYCPYPHPPSKSGENLKGKFKNLERKKNQQPTRDRETVSTSTLRYFEDVNLQIEKQAELTEEIGAPDESENEEQHTTLMRRPRLGRLPSFIPLSPDDKIKNFDFKNKI